MPLDWVVQPETYRSRLASNIRINWESYVDFPLTANNYLIGGVDQERYREMESTEMHVATRGVVHWYIAPRANQNIATSLFAQQWMGLISMRVRKVTGDPLEVGAGIPVVPNYDLRTAPTANEEFMWHREQIVGNLTNSPWSDQAGRRCNWYGSVNVDCRSSRRLDALEQIVLTVQWSKLDDDIRFIDLDPGQLVPLFLHVVPHVRTLLKG